MRVKIFVNGTDPKIVEVYDIGFIMKEDEVVFLLEFAPSIDDEKIRPDFLNYKIKIDLRESEKDSLSRRDYVYACYRAMDFVLIKGYLDLTLLNYPNKKQITLVYRL